MACIVIIISPPAKRCPLLPVTRMVPSQNIIRCIPLREARGEVSSPVLSGRDCNRDKLGNGDQRQRRGLPKGNRQIPMRHKAEFFCATEVEGDEDAMTVDAGGLSFNASSIKLSPQDISDRPGRPANFVSRARHHQVRDGDWKGVIVLKKRTIKSVTQLSVSSHSFWESRD